MLIVKSANLSVKSPFWKLLVIGMTEYLPFVSFFQKVTYLRTYNLRFLSSSSYLSYALRIGYLPSLNTVIMQAFQIYLYGYFSPR